jgi:hypothetical protein
MKTGGLGAPKVDIALSKTSNVTVPNINVPSAQIGMGAKVIAPKAELPNFSKP